MHAASINFFLHHAHSSISLQEDKSCTQKEIAIAGQSRTWIIGASGSFSFESWPLLDAIPATSSPMNYRRLFQSFVQRKIINKIRLIDRSIIHAKADYAGGLR